MSSNNQTINSRTSSSKLSFFKSKAGKIAILILILGGGYYFYQQKNTAVPQINYTLEPVARGSVIAAVSGSGQVSSYNQLDIKPKVSADIISIKVQSGQKVKKGDVLVELDNSDLLTQLKNAQNSLAIAQNNLNLKLIGPTDQDIAISQRSVDSAKLSYDNAVAGLETTKRTLAENLNKAELQVTDTQTNLINTQKDYDNSISSGGIVSQSDTQSLDTAYSSAHSTLSSMQITIRAAVVFADGLLGYNHYGASTNSYQNLLGIRNFQSLSDAQSAYISAEGKMKEFETLYNSLSSDNNPTEISSVLSKATEALQLTKTLSHNLYTLLLNTTTSSDLSQTSLDSLKSSASSNESSSISGISSVQSAIQSIASAKLKISSSQLSSSGSMGSAQTALEKAKTTLATAKRNLEQVKADNATNLYSTQNDIASRKISYESAQAQYNLKIAKPRSVDLVSLRIQVSQAQTSYTDTLKNLKEAEILAPFDGIIIQVNGKEGDAASPVNSILTLGTQKKLATITLNEIDIVKIKSGQKSTITFSAIDGLSLTGEVAEVDNLGVVSQSVVTYTVKIVFDTDDERIKPQMSVSASIITNQSLDALVVPNSAIKQDNSGKSYVETLSAPEPIASSNQVTSKIAPDKKYVQTGLADDSQTEVVSGLNEGDQIITATVNTTQATTKPATTSGLNLLGGGGGGGSNFRRAGQ